MKSVTAYAIARVIFGVAALAAPALAGRALAGPGAAEPDAQAFLRGMGGREIGLGLGLLTTIRAGGPVRPWLISGVLADCGDMAGIAGAWRHMPPEKRLPALAMAGAGAALGAALLAGQSRYAAPTGPGSASDVVKMLQDQGYNVQLNGAHSGHFVPDRSQQLRKNRWFS